MFLAWHKHPGSLLVPQDAEALGPCCEGLYGPFPLVEKEFASTCKALRFLVFAKFALVGQRRALFDAQEQTESVLVSQLPALRSQPTALRNP